MITSTVHDECSSCFGVFAYGCELVGERQYILLLPAGAMVMAGVEITFNNDRRHYCPPHDRSLPSGAKGQC